MKAPSNRWIAGIVLGSIVINQGLLAYGPERSFWEERHREQTRRSARMGSGLLASAPGVAASFGDAFSSALPVTEKSVQPSLSGSIHFPKSLDPSYRSFFAALPLANATVRKISLPLKGAPRGLVFHIQDVHRNLEAQTNIAHVVSALINGSPGKSPIALVGLEGAFRPYDLSWLRSFPDPRATRIAAEDLLAQDRMSGPMFSVLTAPQAIPPVVGIDDESHYTSNINAYRRSLPSKAVLQARTSDLQKKVEDEKARIFNADLLAFDQQVRAYQQGTGSLGTYARALDRKGYSPVAESIALFLRALHIEETLDFKRVETERTQLVEVLAKKLNQTQADTLIAQSVAYRAGQLSYGDFYRWIETLCETAGVALSRFPAMEEYIRYVLLAEGINAESLFHDCQKREQELYRLLAKTEDERRVAEQSHRLILVKKLLDFSLTPEEWAEYELTRARQPPAPELEPYETFYREAHARDEAMAENFLRSVEKGVSEEQKSGPSVSIVVTGGYHAPGLTERLTNAGMAVVSIVPKIQKVDTAQGSAYLTVFAQEKTPLDKLFEGAKLFVADSPLSAENAALQAAGAALAATKPGMPLQQKVLAFLSRQFEGVKIHWEKGVGFLRSYFQGQPVEIEYEPAKPVGKIHPGKLSDDALIQRWARFVQDRGLDVRFLTTGAALVIAGIWFFFTGTGLVQKIGPLLSMVGLMISLQEWRKGTGEHALTGNTSQSSQRPLGAVGQLATPMQSTSLPSGGGGHEERSNLYTNLYSIPPSLINGRLVVVHTTQNDAGIATVQYLVRAGARVVLLSDGKVDPVFVQGLNTDPTFMTGELRRETSNGVSEDKWRWLSVKDKMFIENMSAGSVVIFDNASRDDRMNDLTKRGAMAMEVAGIEPNTLFVLDEQVPATSSPSALDEFGRLLPGVKGPSVENEEIPRPLWGWDPHRILAKGKIVDGDWKPLLHDPNNKEYVFVVDGEAGTYEAISRRQVADEDKDLFGQVMDFIKTQNRVNAGVGTAVDGTGKPRTEKFVKIEEEENINEAFVNFILYFKDGSRKDYKGDVPDGVMSNPDLVLMIIQNTKRATRPGAGVKKVSKIEAENNLEMYKLTPNFIKTQMPMEMFLEWMSKGRRLFVMTLNPFPYFPNHKGRDPKNDVDHVMLSRGDKHVSQSELGSIEFLTDAFEAMDTLNSSPAMAGKIPFHLGMNGWYYGKDFKAGASQNQAHAHLLRERFPVEHAPVEFIQEEIGVKIGYLADPENGPGLVLEANQDNLSSLIQKTHDALSLITGKGDSFNILAFRVGDGYRVIIADKEGGVPPNDWFQNEFAFTESCGRAIMGDDPRKVFKFTDAQIVEYEKIDKDNKTAIVQWVKENRANLEVHPDLLKKARADIVSLSVPHAKIIDFANWLGKSRSGIRATPVGGTTSSSALDSLLSRWLRNGEREAGSPSAALTWEIVRWANDFVLAPIGETGLFFMLPAASGSLFFLGIGLVVFVGLHFWDDYLDGKSNGLSPPDALKKASQLAASRFWRAALLYAMPFTLFILPPELIPLLENSGFGSLLPLVQSSSLYKIAGTVALLHSGRNFLKTLSAVLVKKFPLLASRKDVPLFMILLGMPTLAYAFNMFVNPSLPFLFLAALPWASILGVVIVMVPVFGVIFIVARFISVAGGNESDELEALDHVLGSGLPHWKMAELLIFIAQETQSEKVARAAVHPLMAPWRNLGVNLNDVVTYFRSRGWSQLADEVGTPPGAEDNPRWLNALAESDAKRMASVLFLGENPNLARQQDTLVRVLHETFPNAHRLSIEKLGSPGLNQIRNIGMDFKHQWYSRAFVNNLIDFFKSLRAMNKTGLATFPTTRQSLARQRAFADAKGRDASEENKIPVQLEVYAKEDLPVALETIRLLAEVNKDQEIPVRLLLAGVDEDVIGALKKAAAGNNNVVVADLPVATSGSSVDVWSLNPQALNQEFNTLKGQLNLPDDIALAVSLSEGITFTKTDFDALNTVELDQSLKDALLRLLSLPMVPFHFNTMLKIISKAREGIDQSA